MTDTESYREYQASLVKCPACRGLNWCKACDDVGKVHRSVALLYCELYQTLNDGTTDSQKAEMAAFALKEYGVDIFAPKPKTALDYALDAMGIP